MEEIWKDIKGYEGLYQISNLGRVKSISRSIKLKKYTKISDDTIMKLDLNKSGYLYVSLCKNGKYKKCRVHRLVAEEFVDKPNGKNVVNHKDYNKTNNCSSNLEWVTNEENYDYLRKNMRKRHNVKTNTGERYISYSKKKNRYRITIDGKEYRKCKSLDEAIKERDKLLNEQS